MSHTPGGLAGLCSHKSDKYDIPRFTRYWIIVFARRLSLYGWGRALAIASVASLTIFSCFSSGYLLHTEHVALSILFQKDGFVINFFAFSVGSSGKRTASLGESIRSIRANSYPILSNNSWSDTKPGMGLLFINILL